MKCHEVEAWMLADETPNRPPAEVRRHLRSCAGCRRGFGRLVRLIHEVSTAPLPATSVAARDRLLAQLEPRPATIPLPAPARTKPRTPRIWLAHPLARWAAAAMLFLGLGLGLAYITRPRSADSRTRSANNAETVSGPVEDRVLSRHLVLSETREPERRVSALNDMATDVREESMVSARKGATDDLSLLVWLHARILHEGVLRSARALPGNNRFTMTPILEQLERAEQSVEKLARNSPHAVSGSLHQLGQQVHDTLIALRGGPDGAAPAAQPPAVVSKRSLLQMLVVSSLQVAQEEDPVKRAEHSTDVAGRLADTLVEQAGKGDADDAKRLAESLEKVMERGVQGNLDNLDLDKMDDVRRKQVDRVQERAEAAMQKLQPNLLQMPIEAQKNLIRALELAEQLQKMQQKGHGKGKGKGKKPRDHDKSR